MTSAVKESNHASCERTADKDIQEHSRQLKENSTLTTVLNAMPQQVAILDENRQIIAVNEKLLNNFGADQIDQILGRRTGELLNCKFSDLTPGGCGTTEACRNCGAGNAILAAQKGESTTNACQITTADNSEALDLCVTASPAQFEGRTLTIVSVRDIAAENRRKVLERTFFHDVLNAAGGASGIANLLIEAEDMDEVREFAPLLVSVTDQLIAEIHSQRDMLAAERGDLTVKAEACDPEKILLEVMGTYANHQVAEGRQLKLVPFKGDQEIQTSKPLLLRILGNMVKNALEATAVGETVKVGGDFTDGVCCLWVNNPTVIPRATQLQIFNRSFSTKGQGRGIGTYSIRLLGEKYLGGRVSFDSQEPDGTTFRIQLPLRLPD